MWYTQIKTSNLQWNKQRHINTSLSPTGDLQEYFWTEHPVTMPVLYIDIHIFFSIFPNSADLWSICNFSHIQLSTWCLHWRQSSFIISDASTSLSSSHSYSPLLHPYHQQALHVPSWLSIKPVSRPLNCYYHSRGIGPPYRLTGSLLL